MYNSDTNHLFSIKVQFGQAALQITAISPFFFSHTPKHSSSHSLVNLLPCDKPKPNNHLCATENISALGLNEGKED